MFVLQVESTAIASKRKGRVIILRGSLKNTWTHCQRNPETRHHDAKTLRTSTSHHSSLVGPDHKHITLPWGNVTWRKSFICWFWNNIDINQSDFRVTFWVKVCLHNIFSFIYFHSYAYEHLVNLNLRIQKIHA